MPEGAAAILDVLAAVEGKLMLDALTGGDAADAAGLSALFGWPHRVEDWAWFLGLGRGVAWREDGVLLGTAMTFVLDDLHASIGLVQVSPALQGRGIGRRLMEASIAVAGGRSVLLHSTEAGAGLYARLGFVARGVVEQWHGEAVAAEGASGAVRVGGAGDGDGVARLDRAAVGLDRRSVRAAVLGVGSLMLSGPAGGITGYAVRRAFGRGQLIGPVVAGSEGEALALIGAFGARGFHRVDVPAGRPGVVRALEAMGLRPAGEVQAMALGPWPEGAAGARCFGLVSQALG